MSEEFMKRIYLPFEQADTQISQKYGGTGLGMAITYNLVDLLGGNIHVESKLGEGTTFTVELPFDLPQGVPKHKTWQLDALSVLIVDDEEDACTHTSLFVETDGYYRTMRNVWTRGSKGCSGGARSGHRLRCVHY